MPGETGSEPISRAHRLPGTVGSGVEQSIPGLAAQFLGTALRGIEQIGAVGGR
jgi:hypothetical protein